MKIVVDTNIAFSAILNTNSKIAFIILQPRSKINFYSTEQLLTEIHEHKGKLKELTDYTDFELDRVISLVIDRIRFINVKLIPKSIYDKSEFLTKDIDEDDCEFVALTEHLKGKLWSGDKALKKGLLNKKWDRFISTNELYQEVKK